MGIFEAFGRGSDVILKNIQYGPYKTPVTADVLIAGFLYAAAIVTFSMLIALPASRGFEKLFNFLRWITAIWVLLSIMVCNFGQDWEVAEIHTKTPYKAGSAAEITAHIGVKIGLRSVNITLRGDPVTQKISKTVNETVDYNERFRWDNQGWTQGRFGFGPFSGRVQQEFRDAQRKGLPYPILWIAEYFTFDGEGVRWGRHYRQAGYFTHIMLWSAFPLWLLTGILYRMNLVYGSFFCILTGVTLITGNVLYSVIRNPLELVIPFNDDVKLTFTWGWCFWLCLGTGVWTVLLGSVVLIVYTKKPEYASTFFVHDIANDYEEKWDTNTRNFGIQVNPQPTSPQPQANGSGADNEVEGRDTTRLSLIENESSSAEDLYENVHGTDTSGEIYDVPVKLNRVLVPKNTLGRRRRSTKKKRKPVPLPRGLSRELRKAGYELNASTRVASPIGTGFTLHPLALETTVAAPVDVHEEPGATSPHPYDNVAFTTQESKESKF